MDMNYERWEWTASLIASFAMGWFVHDVTQNFSFHRLYNIVAPTGGPTEIIGFAVIIWLYAKYQRFQLTLPAPALTAKL